MSEVASNSQQPQKPNYRVPGDNTFRNAAKIAIVEDKPIMMDYWTLSLDKKAIIGVRENGEKLLVKSADEYTSPIANLYKVNEDFIVKTENSIYIVAADINTKRIS